MPETVRCDLRSTHEPGIGHTYINLSSGSHCLSLGARTPSAPGFTRAVAVFRTRAARALVVVMPVSHLTATRMRGQ